MRRTPQGHSEHVLQHRGANVFEAGSQWRSWGILRPGTKEEICALLLRYPEIPPGHFPLDLYIPPMNRLTCRPM